MNIDTLLEELYAYSMFSIRLGLDNIKEICKYLGNPQNSYKVIHITGTNGKGSVSTTVERILLEAGYKVGKYTSPHILEFNERISFNDRYISNEDVAKYYEKVKKIIDKHNIQATFFEVTTAMMFNKSHKKILKLIETFSNEELFLRGIYKWVGGSTLGSYFVSTTSSHYEWAMKKLKAHQRNCKKK